MQFQSVYDPYFQQVLTYKLGLLAFRGYSLQGDKESLNILERDLLYEAPVLYDNKDYFVFLKYFYFWRWMLPRNWHFKSIENQSAFESMLKELTVIENDTVRQFAVLNSCRRAFTSSWGPAKSILNNILDSLTDKGLNNKIKLVARNLKFRYNALALNNTIKDFQLSDVNGELRKLSDYKGKYVLIDFWFIGCGWCIKAMPLKKRLKKELAENFEIIAINPVDNLERVQKFLKTRNFDWVFLNAKNNRNVTDYFLVDAYPKYILIDPDGKVVLLPTGPELSFSAKQIREIVLQK